MPDARKQKNNQNIPNGGSGTVSAAAQGDIDVLPKPGSQGDVPSSPEFAD